jgi:secreted trypsin-like serine protease
VLTAAHCIESANPKSYTVYAGAFDLSKINLFPTQRMRVKQIIIVIKIYYSILK